MEIRLSKWQTEVWDDPTRFKVINVGRRAGKTVLCILKLIHFADSNIKQTVWYIAPTYKQAKLIAWEMLKEYIPKHLILKTNDTELIVYLKNGSTIHLKGADNPDSLRGVKINYCIFDECAFISKWNEVWKVMRPTLIDSRADAWFVSTPNGFNHFHKLFNRHDDEYKSFHFTSYDNPYLPREELKKLQEEEDESVFAQEYLAEFRQMKGLIYKGFNRKTHMVDVPDITGWTMTRAIDFGFAHKTALVYFAIAPDGSAIYGFDGLYASNMDEDQIADAIRIKDAGKIITNPLGDSAQPQIIEGLKRKGILFNPVTKGADSVKNGIVKVAGLLKIRKDTGKPTLMFDKNLEWIADEFEKYRWVENKSADNYIKEVPYKVEDDAMDAIRYFAMGYQESSDIDPNEDWAEEIQGIW